MYPYIRLLTYITVTYVRWVLLCFGGYALSMDVTCRGNAGRAARSRRAVMAHGADGRIRARAPRSRLRQSRGKGGAALAQVRVSYMDPYTKSARNARNTSRVRSTESRKFRWEFKMLKITETSQWI